MKDTDTMSSLRKQISKFLKYSVLRRPKRKEKDWIIEKNEVLKKAKNIFTHDITLDVTKRYSTYIFHDKGNSLINRGAEYEVVTQHALMVLLFLDKLRSKSTIFADVGANIGLHTFYIKNKYPELNIIAIDPSPASWEYMELSINYNKIHGIRLERIALSDKNELLDFYCWGNESSADSLKDTCRVLNVKPNIIQVPAKRLDDIEGLPFITVMKMDCEGAELSILKGAIRTLKENRPLLLLEFNPTNRKAFNVATVDIFNFISEMNYSLYSLHFELLDAGKFDNLQQISEENYILLPDEFLVHKNMVQSKDVNMKN